MDDASGAADGSSDDSSDLCSDSEAAPESRPCSPTPGPSFVGGARAVGTCSIPPTPDFSNALDPSLFTNWEVPDVNALTQPPGTASNPWLWLGTPSSSSLQTPESDFLSSGRADEDHLRYSLLSTTDIMQDMSERREEPNSSSHNRNTSTSCSSPPAANGSGECTGAQSSVTIILRQADSRLAQEVIGNLAGLNADLTIRLLKD